MFVSSQSREALSRARTSSVRSGGPCHTRSSSWAVFAMPTRPPSPCTAPGCPEISHAPMCLVHTREEQQRYDKQRGSPTARGYDSAWRKVREQVLCERPWCEENGCNRRATQVDHVLSLRKGGTDDMENLRPMCARHHSRKTVREDGRWG